MKTKWLIITAFFVVLFIIGAFIKIPMFPVAITLQSIFVALSGIMLGYKRAFLAVSCYIISGLLGLPVFSGGSGFMYILNPMFGYLLGFILCSIIVGIICDKFKCLTKINLFVVAFLGHVLIYLTGVIYYIFLLNIYFDTYTDIFSLLYSCVLIFIPGDVIKCVIIASLGKKITKLKKEWEK